MEQRSEEGRTPDRAGTPFLLFEAVITPVGLCMHIPESCRNLHLIQQFEGKQEAALSGRRGNSQLCDRPGFAAELPPKAFRWKGLAHPGLLP